MNLKKFAAGLLFLSGTCLLVLTGCGPAESGEAPQTESAAPSVEIASTADINELGLIEDKSVYADDDPAASSAFMSRYSGEMPVPIRTTPLTR